MKSKLIIVATLGLSLVPVAAQACRGEQGHRYVVLEQPPSKLPAGAMLLRVRLIGKTFPYDQTSVDAGIPARLLAGGGITPRMIRIRGGGWTSCSFWGASTGYVVGWLDRSGRTPVIDALQYRERRFRTPDEEWSVGYERSQKPS